MRLHAESLCSLPCDPDRRYGAGARSAGRSTAIRIGDQTHFQLAFLRLSVDIPRSVMEAEAPKSGGMIHLQGWLEQNKKRILMVGCGVLVAILALVAYANLRAQNEVKAAEAISEVRADRLPDGSVNPGTGESYVNIANEYAGTKAAARALLLAAGSFYSQGSYAESQARFEEFLNRYPDHSMASQALLGVAANLDAQKNNPLAIAKYEEVRRLYPSQPASDIAHLALARLYEADNRWEDAYAIYEEIVTTHSGSGMGAEAGMRLEDLKERHPELVKTNAAPMSALIAPETAAQTNLPMTLDLGVTNPTATPPPSTTPNDP